MLENDWVVDDHFDSLRFSWLGDDDFFNCEDAEKQKANIKNSSEKRKIDDIKEPNSANIQKA